MLYLSRFAYAPFGTFGEMMLPNGIKIYSVERPWMGNKPNISCIPVGVYQLKKDTYKGLYENYAVQDVPDRSAIEIHRGNVPTEFKGCIGIGMELGGLLVDGVLQWGVNKSEQGLNMLMGSMHEAETGTLIIHDNLKREYKL